MEPIKFYTTKDEHGYMSNFARYKVECFGRVWMTSEHAYQAQKFAGMNEEDYDAVFNADRPMVAAAIGRDPNRAMRSDWDQVKDDVMRFVVYHKFSQNPSICEKLLATGERPLFEFDCKRGDQYWAIDRFGRGKNMLGVILMEVREVLQEDQSDFARFCEERKACSKCNVQYDGTGAECWQLCKEHETWTAAANIYLASLNF